MEKEKLGLEEIRYIVMQFAYGRKVEAEDNGSMIRLHTPLYKGSEARKNYYQRLGIGMLKADLEDLGMKTTGIGKITDPYGLQFYVDVIGTLREEVTDKEL